MKIGLLTYHDTTNYGAVLQCVALCKAIESLGMQCDVINYQCENIRKRELPYVNMKGSFRSFVGSLYRFPYRWIKHYHLYNFLSKNCKISKSYTKDTVKCTNDVYDRFIVGSDILWNLDINGHDYTYFLDFVLQNTKKYSYGTSSGDEWDKEDLFLVKKYLSQFKRISVRESYTSDILKKYIDNPISVVCDPTMLMEAEYWKTFIKEKNTKSRYVLIYLPNEKCISDAVMFAQKNNLQVRKLHYYSTIKDFFTAINNATVVFTGSYHGLLFSMYFHTDFFYYNFQDTFRMNFLRDMFQIGHREATNMLCFEDMLSINWIDLDKKIETFRKVSFEYLENILNDM